ncbi:hypothetical protein BD770DRAFT_204888 [Pilaira anomala]|nr:hypothetical protein BD770DRAFT_204888 [Pilaira anomala]
MINKKILKNARNRELLYAEAQNEAINEQRKELKKNKEPKAKRFGDIKGLFNSISHMKPKNFKTLYYKTLSRNHILDISDTAPEAPFMLLTNGLRTHLIQSFKGKEPNPNYKGMVESPASELEPEQEFYGINRLPKPFWRVFLWVRWHGKAFFSVQFAPSTQKKKKSFKGPEFYKLVKVKIDSNCLYNELILFLEHQIEGLK